MPGLQPDELVPMQWPNEPEWMRPEALSVLGKCAVNCVLLSRPDAAMSAAAAKLGIELPISIDQRMAGAEKVGAHKTSMLQDWEAGRPMELEAVVGAVVELGERLGVPMPSTRAVYACAKLLDEHRGQRVLEKVEGVAQ